MAILAQYNFTSGFTVSSNDSSITAGTVTEGSLSLFSNTTVGAATDPILVANPPDSDSNTASEAIGNDSYFFFAITPVSGSTMSLTTLTFNIARGGASTPRGYDVRSSADGFAATLGSANVSTQRPTFTPVSIDLSGASFQSVSGTITFRIYIFAPTDGNSLDIDDIVVNGAIGAGGTIEQEGFRFRADDGSETAATWIEPQDTNIIRAASQNTRLRVLLNATNDPGSNNFQLEYRKVGDAEWKVIDTA